MSEDSKLPRRAESDTKTIQIFMNARSSLAVMLYILAVRRKRLLLAWDVVRKRRSACQAVSQSFPTAAQ
ncbi:hypothetical protein CR512_26920 [Pseudomonas putida]|nr:hypothetical protein CR512_26920 [Pseudomonas putida]